MMDRNARAPPCRVVAEEEGRRRLRCSGRFLRPGALARLRDSKIVARSLRSASAARLPLPSFPLPSASGAAEQEQQQQGGVPHFPWVCPDRGPRGVARYPLRRRMVAARVFPLASHTEARFLG